MPHLNSSKTMGNEECDAREKRYWLGNIDDVGNMDGKELESLYVSKVPLASHADLEPYIQRIADGDTSPLLTKQLITTLSLRVYPTREGGKILEFIYGNKLFKTKGGLSAGTATTITSQARVQTEGQPTRLNHTLVRPKSAEYGSTESWIGVNMDPSFNAQDVTFVVVPTFSYFEFIPLHLQHHKACDHMVSNAVVGDVDYLEDDPVPLSKVEIGKQYEIVLTTFTAFVDHGYIVSRKNNSIGPLELCIVEQAGVRKCNKFVWYDPELDNSWYREHLYHMYGQLHPHQMQDIDTEIRSQELLMILQDDFASLQDDHRQSQKNASFWKKTYECVLGMIIEYVEGRGPSSIDMLSMLQGGVFSHLQTDAFALPLSTAGPSSLTVVSTTHTPDC
ncbi:indole-3-acetic acid-amido synthetase GH3.10 [Tanacetum coccineum]|uniref:Indole-3-acetic acid-amido synthetase GH3.10 n=1 Tax=Tanacetum coccineum TaxID=301880 RepID=A0ABQ5BQC5_9ASTR